MKSKVVVRKGERQPSLRAKKAAGIARTARRPTLDREKREYENVLSSLMGMKQGKAEAYSDLVEQAMQATDNIMKFRKNSNDRSKNKAESDSTYSECSVSGSDSECERKEQKVNNKVKAMKMLQRLKDRVKGGEQLNTPALLDVLQSIGEQATADGDGKHDKSSRNNDSEQCIETSAEKQPSKN